MKKKINIGLVHKIKLYTDWPTDWWAKLLITESWELAIGYWLLNRKFKNKWNILWIFNNHFFYKKINKCLISIKRRVWVISFYVLYQQQRYYIHTYTDHVRTVVIFRLNIKNYLSLFLPLNIPKAKLCSR